MTTREQKIALNIIRNSLVAKMQLQKDAIHFKAFWQSL